MTSVANTGKEPSLPGAWPALPFWHDDVVSIFSKFQEFMGLDTVQVLNGYRTNSRGPRLPVCEVCGAVVAYESQRSHADWHARER